MRHSIRFGVVAAAAAAAVLGACSNDPAPPALTTSGAYVALGDSYVSGPLIGVQDPTSPACLRSDRNYPSLVAEELGVSSFVDVSCGGETTGMMKDGRTEADGTTIAPQLDSVSSRTKLVTIGIGGNDEGSTAGLFNYCLLPATANDRMCTEFVSTYMPKVYPKIRQHVVSVVANVRSKAPGARIVLTGYLRIAPETGTCAALPLSDARRQATRTWEAKINSTLTAAARESKVSFVDVQDISLGHDACSVDDPWVNGVENSPDNDGAFLHPTEAGMKQVAQAVLKVVRAGAPG